MEFNSKSAIAEDHFKKSPISYIIQEKQITERNARQSKLLKVQLTRRKNISTVGSLCRPVTIVTP